MFAPISPTLGSRRVLTALLCAYTEAGTIPGAPLADLLYQLVIASSYQCLWDCLRAEDLLEHVGTVEACLLTWLDDFAIPVGADSAQALPCRLGRVASLTASGISMNFSPGKKVRGGAKGPLMPSGRSLLKMQDTFRSCCPLAIPHGWFAQTTIFNLGPAADRIALPPLISSDGEP